MPVKKKTPGRKPTAALKDSMHLGLRISKTQYELLCAACDETGLSKANVVRAALSEWIMRHNR